MAVIVGLDGGVDTDDGVKPGYLALRIGGAHLHVVRRHVLAGHTGDIKGLLAGEAQAVCALAALVPRG